MITFFTGKPGDGKSFYATAKILDVLTEGDAYVVTNVPLNAPQVCEFVTKQREKRKDDRPFVFDDSVRVLKDDEVYEFYRRRSGGLVLAESPDFACDVRERLDRPEFVAHMKKEFLRIKENVEWQRPCWYYIDEAHNFFSAREWASAGRGMLYYASQHRHLHDQIFFITQVVDNVEKQLRGLASELHRIRNHMRRSVGPFKMRPCFKVAKFYGCPGDQTTAQTFDTETMFLDPAGVAGCYQTVGALGVQNKPEKLVNAGILPWWLLWVVGIVAVIALGAAFFGLPFMGGWLAKKSVGGTSSVGVVRKYAPGLADVPKDAPSAQTIAPSPQPQKMRPVGADDLYVVSITMGNQRANVTLSDGTVHTEDDGSIKRLLRNAVLMRDGSFLYLRSAPGSGAKRAPVRQDGVPPAVVPAVAPVQGGQVAVQSSSAVPALSQPAAPPIQSIRGSWRRDEDGVQRLTERVELVR